MPARRPSAWSIDVIEIFGMILPSKIDIQIIDTAGRSNLLENVLFGLKVFTSDSSWHNYSFFKSNVFGHVALTKQDIIENTELKWEKNIQVAAPTRFELYVWNGKVAAGLIESTRQSLELYRGKAFVEQDLKQYGIADENIAQALLAIDRQAAEERKFYSYVKDAINNLVKIETEKLEGIWFDDSPKLYQFIIQ